MGNFNRSSSGNRRGNRNFRGRDSGGRFGDRDKERPSMHEAICSECGEECKIPFKPDGDRPVYCSDCFSNRSSDSSGRQRGNNRGKPEFKEKRMFKAICDACGKMSEVPFRPTSGKPVYCDECFSKDRGNKSSDSGRKNSDQHKEHFEMLNFKLDKILTILSSGIEQNSVVVDEKIETEKCQKIKKAKPKKNKKILEEAKVDDLAKKKKVKKKKE